MTKLTTVSICIPTYNQSSFLAAAIDSALNQVGVDVDVFIFDDQSTDSTQDVLATYSSNPRVHSYSGFSNVGVSSNASRAILASNSNYVVRLDSDDILYPDFCQILCHLLDNFPSAGAAHSAVDQIDRAGCITGVRRLGRRSGFQAPTNSLRGSINGYKVSANILMFRREALFSLPFLYDPTIHFAEDWDLFARLAIAGWGNVYTSSILAAYRVWRSPTDFNPIRKIAEIDGIYHVLVNTILPAWESCGWDKKAVSRARRKFASTQSVSLTYSDINEEERALLSSSLVKLAAGDVEFIDRCIKHCLKTSKSCITPTSLYQLSKKLLKKFLCYLT
jgi:glycosyltransferase involved in cell wall biosynthesis